jgi:hypothetical protein
MVESDANLVTFRWNILFPCSCKNPFTFRIDAVGPWGSSLLSVKLYGVLTGIQWSAVRLPLPQILTLPVTVLQLDRPTDRPKRPTDRYAPLQYVAPSPRCSHNTHNWPNALSFCTGTLCTGTLCTVTLFTGTLYYIHSSTPVSAAVRQQPTPQWRVSVYTGCS